MKPKSLIEKIKLSLFIQVLILTVVSFAAAQQKSSVAFASFERAKQILDSAIAAHGGIENVRRADKIAIAYKSVNYPLGQSFSFTAP